MIADEILAEVRGRVGDGAGLDAQSAAQLHHVRGVRHAHGGRVGHFLVELEAAVAAFAAAGDRRNHALEGPTVAWCYAELGDFPRAEQLLREAMDTCERLGAAQTKTYALVNLGYIVSYRGRHEEARAALDQAIIPSRAQQNPRLEGWARVHLSTIATMLGEHEEAEKQAFLATELLVVSPGLRAWARASRARALMALGRIAEAREEASTAMAALVSAGSILQGQSMVPLVYAEALHAAGDVEASRVAIADARTRLFTRADELPNADWRASFLALPDHLRTTELWEAWGAGG